MRVSSIPRSTVVYVALIVVLGAVFAIQEGTSPRRNTIPVPELPEGVDRIAIEEDGGRLELRRTDGGWVVSDEEYPVDGAVVGDLLEAIGSLESADVITLREGYDEYGLDSASERVVRFFAGDLEPLSIQLGESAAAGDAVYARINRSREVVLVPQSIDALVTTDADEFREREIVAIDEESVVRVTIESPAYPDITVQRSEDGEATWVAETPVDDEVLAEMDESAYRNLFTELSSLNAQGFLPEDTHRTASAELATIRVERTSGAPVTITLYPPDEERVFPVVASGSEYPFTVPAWRARRLVLGLERYIPSE